MTPPKKRTSRKSDWRASVKARLRQLQQAAGGSNRKFGKRIGVDPRRVTTWLDVTNPKGLPGTDNLYAIAERMDISVDWLLSGTDAEGKPSAEIQYRVQWRNKPELEDDLAVAIWREVQAAGVPIPDVSLSIYPPHLFRAVVEIVKRDVAVWAKQAEEEEPLADAISALSQALAAPVADVDRKAAWKAARKALIQLVVNRDVSTSVVRGSALRFAVPDGDEDGHLFSARILASQPRSVFAPADPTESASQISRRERRRRRPTASDGGSR